ncbi:hypothetical protein, partial [Neisseria sp. P0004.S002]|uniref:hypothetical protein n=1 Tax=Neisseria sp. P0004.S002 TaxID=3436666 RepID=UPI003F7EF811
LSIRFFLDCAGEASGFPSSFFFLRVYVCCYVGWYGLFEAGFFAFFRRHEVAGRQKMIMPWIQSIRIIFFF